MFILSQFELSCTSRFFSIPTFITKNRLQHRYFPVNFAKFLRTPILKVISFVTYFEHSFMRTVRDIYIFIVMKISHNKNQVIGNKKYFIYLNFRFDKHVFFRVFLLNLNLIQHVYLNILGAISFLKCFREYICVFFIEFFRNL